MKRDISVLGNWLLILLVIYFSYQLLFVNPAWIFLDSLNLFIHETGHLLFLPFGQFIQILGGSLFQICFPFCFLFYFLFRKELFSASFILFWIGDNIVNVSIYMRDAKLMQLPLLGGDGTIHDWNFLFTKIGLLQQSQSIGMAFFTIGIVCLVISVLAMILFTVLKMLNKSY